MYTRHLRNSKLPEADCNNINCLNQKHYKTPCSFSKDLFTYFRERAHQLGEPGQGKEEVEEQKERKRENPK